MTDSMTPEQALAAASAAVMTVMCYRPDGMDSSLEEEAEWDAERRATVDALIEAAQRVARSGMPCYVASELQVPSCAAAGLELCESCEARATPVERDQREST